MEDVSSSISYKDLGILKNPQSLNIFDCIKILSRDFENKYTDNEAVQELFFRIASKCKALPKDTNTTSIDSFIFVLMSIISMNCGLPISVKGLNLLLVYLKNDERVFKRFTRNKELLVQLKFENYLLVDKNEGRKAALEFIAFLYRTCEELTYDDFVKSSGAQTLIKKAELGNLWMSIDNMTMKQEEIVNGIKENQSITSSAFTELFVYVESVKETFETNSKQYEQELEDIKQYIYKGQLNTIITNIEIHKSLIERNSKRIESLEISNEYNKKRLDEVINSVEEVSARINDVIRMLSFEEEIGKNTRNRVLARISKMENDIFVLSNRMMTGADNKVGEEEGLKLATHSLRTQMEREVLPKVNEMQVRLESIELAIKAHQSKNAGTSPISAMLSKLEDKTINGISDLIKTSLDATTIEIAGYKRELIGYNKSTNEFKEQVAAMCKVQSSLNDNNKQINSTLTNYIKKTDDFIKDGITEIESLKSQVEDLKNIGKVTNAGRGDNEEETKMQQLEERLTQAEGNMNDMISKFTDVKTKGDSLSKLVEYFKTQSDKGLPKGEVQNLREEFIKRTDQLQQQIKGYFNSSCTYIQQFADLHAYDKLKEIKSLDTDYTAKLDCLVWLIRYNRYLSKKSFLLVVESFKEIINAGRVNERTPYSSAKHSSGLMSLLINSMRNSLRNLGQVLSEANTYLIILEVAIVNEQNLDNGISLGLIRELLQYITMFMSSYDIKQCLEEFKLTVRCMAYCFKNVRAIDSLLEVNNGITTVVKLIQAGKEESIIVNAIKIVRMCLRSDKQYDKIVHDVPGLFFILMQYFSISNCSKPILEEITAALMNYTRKAYVVEAIEDPMALKSLCILAAEKEKSACRDYCIEILKNCCRCQRLLDYIKHTSSFEILFKDPEDVLEFSAGAKVIRNCETPL